MKQLLALTLLLSSGMHASGTTAAVTDLNEIAQNFTTFKQIIADLGSTPQSAVCNKSSKQVLALLNGGMKATPSLLLCILDKDWSPIKSAAGGHLIKPSDDDNVNFQLSLLTIYIPMIQVLSEAGLAQHMIDLTNPNKRASDYNEYSGKDRLIAAFALGITYREKYLSGQAESHIVKEFFVADGAFKDLTPIITSYITGCAVPTHQEITTIMTHP
jgi:hypothetical protein